MAGTGASRIGASELALRVFSSLLLAPLAIVTAFLGGWPFLLFWGIAALGILWEWTRLVGEPRGRPVLLTGAASIASALALLAVGRAGLAMLFIGLGVVLGAGLASSDRRLWSAGGIAYAGAGLVAPVLLRDDPEYGLAALMFLFAVVWATDIAAYFVGRSIGGPRLALRLSPNKTWSGAIGGTAGGAAAGVGCTLLFGLAAVPVLAFVSMVLSVLAQAGDLLESAIKRRFGAKDTSQLIPGHGGLMDRLDGFLAAAFVAATFGLLRGGIDNPARGLLLW